MRNSQSNFIPVPTKPARSMPRMPRPPLAKRTSSSQTERLVLIKEENLSFYPCSKLSGPNDNGMRRDYVKAVNYINSCHKFINSIVEKNTIDKSNLFLLPMTTNFFPLFSILVGRKSRTSYGRVITREHKSKKDEEDQKKGIAVVVEERAPPPRRMEIKPQKTRSAPQSPSRKFLDARKSRTPSPEMLSSSEAKKMNLGFAGEEGLRSCCLMPPFVPNVEEILEEPYMEEELFEQRAILPSLSMSIRMQEPFFERELPRPPPQCPELPKRPPEEPPRKGQVTELLRDQINLFLSGLKEEVQKVDKKKEETRRRQKCKSIHMVSQHLRDLTEIGQFHKSMEARNLSLATFRGDVFDEQSIIPSDTEYEDHQFVEDLRTVPKLRGISVSSLLSDSSDIRSDSDLELK